MQAAGRGGSEAGPGARLCMEAVKVHFVIEAEVSEGFASCWLLVLIGLIGLSTRTDCLPGAAPTGRLQLRCLRMVLMSQNRSHHGES